MWFRVDWERAGSPGREFVVVAESRLAAFALAYHHLTYHGESVDTQAQVLAALGFEPGVQKRLGALKVPAQRGRTWITRLVPTTKEEIDAEPGRDVTERGYRDGREG